MNKIICGDALATLKTLESGIVQTCCTSPPYFGLRDYGTGQWAGGNDTCTHRVGNQVQDNKAPGAIIAGMRPGTDASTCKICGATRIDQQIGLEDTPEAYIARLVEVFREVKRVLRDDGTCWIVIGDSYAGSGKGYGDKDHGKLGKHAHEFLPPPSISELPPKSLMGIPWRLAFALQDDGWILRMDCIWHKPNCMPESVEDRPTKSHEYIFLLSKSERYFYDADAIREPAQDWGPRDRSNFRNGTTDPLLKHHGFLDGNFAEKGRNKRSVWRVSTQSYSEAHFATFPPKLIEPCILAGTSARACEHCGAPWERVTEATGHINKREPAHAPNNCPTKIDSTGWAPTKRVTDAWEPTCSHTNDGTAQSIVLDPFCGAGTVPLVSIQHHRQYIGIELNPDYVKLIQERIETVQPVLWEIPA